MFFDFVSIRPRIQEPHKITLICYPALIRILEMKYFAVSRQSGHFQSASIHFARYADKRNNMDCYLQAIPHPTNFRQALTKCRLNNIIRKVYLLILRHACLPNRYAITPVTCDITPMTETVLS